VTGTGEGQGRETYDASLQVVMGQTFRFPRNTF